MITMMNLLTISFSGDVTKWVSYVVFYDAYNTGRDVRWYDDNSILQ